MKLFHNLNFFSLKLLLFGLLMAISSSLCFAQPSAFPGAEGWGAASAGGRGGEVIEVTNLNDNGPGSFREAVNTAGARTIVFRTGGVIELLSEMQITEPYIYIAGQTAPGDGIVLKNFPLTCFTHDVIIRGLRIRSGDEFPQMGPDNRDCLTIEDGSYNVIADHCSFSWAIDETVSILGSGVHSVSIQWCIISEALFASIHPKGFHSMGILVGYDASKTSIHHNLFAHNAGRNPLFARQSDHEFINNVVYDWLYSADLNEDGAQLKVDYVGNYLKPLTYTSAPELPLQIDFDSSTVFGSRLFMEDNFLSPDIFFLTQAQINTFGGNAILISNSSLLSAPSTVTRQTAAEAYDTVLAWTGALHPQRDGVDNRILQSVVDSTGGLVDCMDADPILLDSGNVIGASASTIIYSQLGRPIPYSAESRKIVITGGTGAGQVRYGAQGGLTVLDTVNFILEATVNTPWTVIPDATSTYKFFAGCNTNVGGFPAYLSGTPPADSDHDGMPDSWETAHSLNPNNPADRNGTNLSSEGYTNLEVYLNEYYAAGGNVAVADVPQNLNLRSYPNPFSDFSVIEFNNDRKEKYRLTVYNMNGQEVLIIDEIKTENVRIEKKNLVSGMYFFTLQNNSGMSYHGKLAVE